MSAPSALTELHGRIETLTSRMNRDRAEADRLRSEAADLDSHAAETERLRNEYVWLIGEAGFPVPDQHGDEK